MNMLEETLDKKRVAAYCRVSTEKDEQIHSLLAQKEYFEKYCADKKMELTKIYADEGISGKQMKNRKQFLQMLHDAENDKFDLLLCKDVMRYARNTEDFLNSIRKIRALGKNIYFVTHNLDIQEGSEFYLTMLSAIAQEESANTSKKIKFGKNITAKKGRVPNFVFGYDRIDNYTLKPNPEEAEVVKKIFDLYVNEGYGGAKIAKYLNNNDIKTKKSKVGKKNGAKWSQKTVSDLLKNEIYIGTIVNNKSEVIDFITGKRVDVAEGERNTTYKPEFAIIDEELFYMTQDILRQRREELKISIGKTRESSKYVFSNLIRCSECGYSFRRIQRHYASDRPVYIWWACSYRNSYGVDSCSNNLIVYEDELLESIQTFLNSILKNKNKTIKVITNKVKAILETQNKDVINNLKDVQDEYNSLMKIKENRIAMFDRGIITIDELQEQTKDLNNKINRIKISLNNARNQTALEFNIDNVVTDYFKNLENIVNKKDITNEMLKKIIDKIEVFPNGDIKVHLKLINRYNLSVDFSMEDIISIPLEEIAQTVPDTNHSTYCSKNKEWNTSFYLRISK